MKLLKTNAFIDNVYSCSFVSIVAKKIRKLDSGTESRRFNLLLAEEANVADVACCLRDRLGLPQHIQLELPQDLQSLQGEVHVQVPATALMRLPEEVEPVPASAVLNTELAHERALMAWTRTSLATTKMMFCFAFVPIAYDKRFKISYSMILSIALVVVATLALLVGWQRYHQVKQLGMLRARRIDVRPAFFCVILYVVLCCGCVFLKF